MVQTHLKMSPSPLELTAAFLFFCAVLHTFFVDRFRKQSKKFRAGSVGENLFHFLGEVEVVFGLWGALLLACFSLLESPTEALHYLESRNFTEPMFVLVVMSICATKPILNFANHFLIITSKILPMNRTIAFFSTTLFLGPLLGSFITEPAAMTVTALILLKSIFERPVSARLKYATLGVLFVNVSVGGTLTPYAAPPVLMVADAFGWDVHFMLRHFGWKAILACAITTSMIAYRFRKELSKLPSPDIGDARRPQTPLWVSIAHLMFLMAAVMASHHPVVFTGAFLFFLGFHQVTEEHQNRLQLREGLLVAFFLAGLVVLGGLQQWWLSPILTSLSEIPLYFGAMGLTAITDNAALTYLGSLVPDLSEAARYALVAGSVVGGGLTVIANAPNPAGFGILNASFGSSGIGPVGLLKAALLPTLIAAVCFWL
jgi:Na+/H+ antiporter NhaD/arsenite permease-like protein